MGRRSSGGRSARAPARAPARKTPAPAKQTPPHAPVQSSGGGSVIGAIVSTIADGVAFGAANAVAHRVVDAVMGPRTVRHETVAAAPKSTATATATAYSDACGTHYKVFQDCINSSGSDISKCQFYMDLLSECRKGSGLAA
ncbi:hypothetical protein M8C21_026842 [Ambrosia artemisiifolia]|uniref:CHCH domain-containing protein n=1 Tax=Ambrosia artemisiifolia TaxID=4212 RepID=A0AAD5GNA5_AMBAR|nr:hypothetical protein M8C21_026842 [Ambrosia artemisiifolia]